MVSSPPSLPSLSPPARFHTLAFCTFFLSKLPALKSLYQVCFGEEESKLRYLSTRLPWRPSALSVSTCRQPLHLFLFLHRISKRQSLSCHSCLHKPIWFYFPGCGLIYSVFQAVLLTVLPTDRPPISSTAIRQKLSDSLWILRPPGSGLSIVF